MAERYAANPQYSATLPMQELPCVPPGVQILHRSILNLQKELGEGCFGKVYEGTGRLIDLLPSAAFICRSNHCFLEFYCLTASPPPHIQKALCCLASVSNSGRHVCAMGKA